MSTQDDKELEERLAQVEAEQAEEAAAEKRAAKLRKIEEHNLVKLHSKTLGKRGLDFEIIDTKGGFVVVKRGESVLFKSFVKSETTEDTNYHFVKQQLVSPSLEELDKITSRFSGTMNVLVLAILQLHDGRRGEVGKK